MGSMNPPSAPALGPTDPGERRPPTIYDVARAAGVSHQTVSRFLKGDTGIKPRNYDRVLQALNELGYRPNLAARSLATRRSHRVAVLVQAIDQVGPARILHGLITEARAAGYLIDVVTVEAAAADAVAETIRAMSTQDIAGIIALTSTDEMTAALTGSDFHLPALVHFETEDAADPDASEEHARGLRSIVDHLVELGHRRFFHIGGPPNWIASRNREHAYLEALSRHGITSLGTAHGDWSAASGYRLARSVGADLGVTAMVCANDQTAIGAIRALVERGMRVPADVSVTGVDDIPEAAFIQPPLTTLRLAFEQQGRRAFRDLLGLLGDAIEPFAELPVELVVRESTGPAPTR